jgi:hypothetical protein
MARPNFHPTCFLGELMDAFSHLHDLSIITGISHASIVVAAADCSAGRQPGTDNKRPS